MIDIDKVRADTPACEQVLHFNNAGASLMPRQVYEAVKGVLDLENSVGGYRAERRLADDLQSFYSEFAALLNARPDEIAFVENATRAWDMAFYALPSNRATGSLHTVQNMRRTSWHFCIRPKDVGSRLT